MRLKPLLTALTLALLATPAAAWVEFDGFRGNDTGGIIPWSQEAELSANQRAGSHCARFNKVAIITSVHRVYGDYIGFICAFPRGYDPVKAQAMWWNGVR
jgi:hypothetical protein